MTFSAAVQTAAESLTGSTWSEVHIFSPESAQLSLPTSVTPPNSSDCRSLSKLFTSREYAIRAGIDLSGVSYAVHQYETTRGVDLAYGRSGDAVSGAGASVARVIQKNGGVLYVAISYRFPALSANAVAKLVAFAKTFLDAQSDLKVPENREGNVREVVDVV